MRSQPSPRGPSQTFPGTVKSANRFDYARFGEALIERGLIDREVLSHVLNQVNATRSLLPEVLVRENLVSDWEVSRVACEIYHLPFLTVDHYPPSTNALEGYDLAYLRHFALVPLDRFGALVTVIMPGLVPSEVLEGLRPGQNGRVLPVVGSVVSNRRWLEEHFAAHAPAAPARHAAGGHATGGHPAGSHAAGSHAAAQGKPALDVRGAVPAPASTPAQAEELQLVEGDWGNLFDAGDEAVQLGLKKKRP
jgi:hypothetical protein